MKRYRFRLEHVQRVRRVQADLAAAALGTAQRAEAAAQVEVRVRHDAIAARSRPLGGYTPRRLQAARVLWEAELDALDQAETALIAAGRHRDERFEEWQQAARRVRALELLDERRREEHRAAADRSEAAEVGDLVAARRGQHQAAGRP